MMLELGRHRRHMLWHRAKAVRLAPRIPRSPYVQYVAAAATLAAFVILSEHFLMYPTAPDARRTLALPHAPFALSETDVYKRHFVPPLHDAMDTPQQVLVDLRARNARALAELRLMPTRERAFPWNLVSRSIRPTRGITFSEELVEFGYTHIKQMISPLCLGSAFARVPTSSNRTKPMCLNVVTNAFVSRYGSALHLASKTIFEIAGGCCKWDWPLLKDCRIWIRDRAWDTINHDRRQRILLVLAHHHSSTYFHVMDEVLSRYLQLVRLLDAVPEIDVLLDEGEIARELLLLLGLAPERILQFGSEQTPEWIFHCLLLFPPALHHEPDSKYYPVSSVRDIAGVLRELSMERRVVRQPPNVNGKSSEKPLLLLMERATRRGWLSGRCREHRCVHNFEEVRSALEKAFDNTYAVEVYRATDRIHEALDYFSRAKVVVGVHGAGFQNLMFCSPNTTVIHIGWHDFYRGLSDEFGLSFHQIHVPYLNLATYNYRVRDVGTLIQNITAAVRKDQEKFS